MIKAVFFDLGNVILPVDGNRLARELTRFTSFSQDKILKTICNELTISNFEKGRVSPRSWYKTVCRLCQIQGLPYPRFVRLFNDIFAIDPDVTGLIRRLKNRYKVGLISNTNSLHTRFLLKKYKFFNDFDRMWLSHRIGIRKPDPKIYRLAVSRFSVKPEQSVFIDDLRSNVQGATKIGMKGILFRGMKPLSAELKKMGVHT